MLAPMKQSLCLLLLMFSLSAWSAEQDPYADPNKIVIEGSLKALSRTEDLMSVAQGDRYIVSNSCGYDTVIVEVKDVLVGAYDLKELAAHLPLGEFCESFLQPSVVDYVLFLAWNGTVWEINPRLSSRLLAGPDASLWVVDPVMIEGLRELGGPRPKPVSFPASTLEKLAVESAARLGYYPDVGVDPDAWVKDLGSWLPNRQPKWGGNPIHFREGVPLAEFRRWLAER